MAGRRRSMSVLAAALVVSAACTPKETSRDPLELADLGTRYAVAWSSQDPAALASFYAENGTLILNSGPPSVGRAAVAATAESFMTAFPDMVVKMTKITQEGDHVVFHWLWTGTNLGPGGTGKFVRMTGYEEWTLDRNGLIVESKGHYDEAEYERQLKFGAPPEA